MCLNQLKEENNEVRKQDRRGGKNEKIKNDSINEIQTEKGKEKGNNEGKKK